MDVPVPVFPVELSFTMDGFLESVVMYMVLEEKLDHLGKGSNMTLLFTKRSTQ